MPERAVWGLDIGQTAIRAVKLEAVKNGKDVSALMTDTFFRSLDTTPDDSGYNDKVREALEEFVAVKHPGAQAPVVLSLLGSSALFRSFPVPAVSAGKLREVISYEAKQLIPYPLEEVIWDYQTLGFNEETGEIQVALLCCRRDIIDEMLQVFDDLNIAVADIQIAPLALVNFCRYDFYSEGRMLLLDCGARSTDFVIFDESVFWLRSIPVCGGDISKILMNKFNISYEEAEQLKTNMADPKQAARVFRTIEPTMRNLAAEAQRSIGFYRSTKRDATINELLLAGNTFLMEGADQYMADSLGYGARTLDLPQSIAVDSSVDEDELLGNRQVYGIAAGLALQGLGLAYYECSLLPENRKLAKLVKRKEPFGWLAAAIVVLTVIVEILFTGSKKPLYENDLKKIDEVVNTSSQRYKDYNEKLNQFKPAQNINKAMIDMESGRGMLTAASEQLHQAIEQFNAVQQKKVNAKPLTSGDMREYERNARANIEQYEPSQREYKKLLEEKHDEFKKDYESVATLKNAAALKAEMDENLELQVLRHVLLRHQRKLRTFISDETYVVAKAVKNTDEDGKVEWTLDESSLPRIGTFGKVVTSKTKSVRTDNTSARDSVSVRDEAARSRSNAETNTEDSDGEKSAATGETQPVVVIDIHGYIVDGGTEAIHALQSKLTSLKKQGFYFLGNSEIEGGFVLVRTENKNVINLPEIYSPLPKLVKDDDFGETDELNRSEHLTWKADSENIQSFRARLLYEPQKTVLPQGKFKEMLKNAEDSLKNAKSVSATAGTKQQISSAEGNAEEKNASPAAADKPSDVAKSENAEPKASSAVTEKAVAADKDKAAASVPEKEKTDSEAK